MQEVLDVALERATPAQQVRLHRGEGVRAIGRAVMQFVPAQERRRPEAVALRERLASA